MTQEIKFEDFEYEVMTKLLSGEDTILALLREQYRKAYVEKREFTGRGFFTDFYFQDPVQRIEICKDFEIGDIAGTINNTSIDFVLFIRDGFISFLEGCTFGDLWPEHINNFELGYWGDGERDMVRLREKWSAVNKASD